MSALLELKEAREALDGTRQKLTGLMAKKDDNGKLKWAPEDHDSFKSLNDQAGVQHAEVKKWEAVEEADRRNTEAIAEGRKAASGNPMSTHAAEEAYRREWEHASKKKSISDLISNSPEYKRFVAGNCPSGQPATIILPDHAALDLDRKYAGASNEFKAPLTNATGFPPFAARISDVVPYALRRTMVQDLMPSIQTESYAVKYMEETTSTRNAAPVAEGGLKPTSFRAFTERTALVEVIAALLAVTEQQMMDVPQLMGLINQMLGVEISLAEEDQILNGTGNSPQLQGFLTKTGVLVQATGGDPAESAIFKAITAIRTTGFTEPTAVIIHPNDWMRIVTHQDTTGRFIYGNPNDETARRLWGMPAVVTPAITELTALVGDFAMYAYIARRMGLRIDIGYVNDDFARNQKTLRAEERLALVIRRPTAFAKVTGLPSV